MEALEFIKMPPKGSITLTLRISNDLNGRLEKLVAESGLSKNAIINKMIEYGLKNYTLRD